MLFTCYIKVPAKTMWKYQSLFVSLWVTYYLLSQILKYFYFKTNWRQLYTSWNDILFRAFLSLRIISQQRLNTFTVRIKSSQWITYNADSIYIGEKSQNLMYYSKKIMKQIIRYIFPYPFITLSMLKKHQTSIFKKTTLSAFKCI